MADRLRPHRALVLGVLLILAGLAGCVDLDSDGSSPPGWPQGSSSPVASLSFVETGGSPVPLWVATELTEGRPAGYHRADVKAQFKSYNTDQMTATTYEVYALCETPALDGDAPRCQDPLEPGETWDVGSRIYIPCPQTKAKLVMYIGQLFTVGQVDIGHDTNIDPCFTDSSPDGSETSDDPSGTPDRSSPEQASATARGFAVGGSDTNWIRVTLVKGENAPYQPRDLAYEISTRSGATFSSANSAADYLCTSASRTQDRTASGQGYACAAGDGFQSSQDGWDVGGVLYAPCQEQGDQPVSITIRGTTVLDSTLKCDSAPPTQPPPEPQTEGDPHLFLRGVYGYKNTTGEGQNRTVWYLSLASGAPAVDLRDTVVRWDDGQRRADLRATGLSCSSAGFDGLEDGFCVREVSDAGDGDRFLISQGDRARVEAELGPNNGVPLRHSVDVLIITRTGASLDAIFNTPATFGGNDQVRLR